MKMFDALPLRCSSAGIAVLGLALALCGCISAPTPPQIVQLAACPKLLAWSDQDQDKLKAEYDSLPPDALMRRAFKDYIAMRDETLACAKGVKKDADTAPMRGSIY
jgi:hypothetical protein